MKSSHGSSDCYYDLLNCICLVLTKFTCHQLTIKRAWNDWNILEAVKIHLPLPTPHELSLIDAINHDMADDLPLYDIHGEAYHRVNISMIPISLIQLTMNILQLKEGKNHCLMDGFLHRVLEKLTSIKLKLFISDEHHDTSPSNQQSSISHYQSMPFLGFESMATSHESIPRYHGVRVVLESVNPSRYEGAILFQFIHCMCHYSHVDHGQANGIILSSTYDLLPLCFEILIQNLQIKPSKFHFEMNNYGNIDEDAIKLQYLNRTDRSSHRYREEEFIIQIIRFLCRLSDDVMLFATICEEYDLISIIGYELYYYCDHYPVQAVDLYLHMIDNITSVPISSYLKEYLHLLRVPLLIVSYVYPRVEAQARNCIWMISDVYTGADERFDRKAMDRTNRRPSTTQSSRRDSNQIEANQSIRKRENHPTGNSSRRSSIGLYRDCGVSTCGTLHPDNSTSHRPFLETVPQNNDIQLPVIPSQKIPVTDEDVCEISRLSAKSRKLREFIENRKISYGYKPRRKPVTKPQRVMKLEPLDKEKELEISKKICRMHVDGKDSMLVISVDDMPQLAMTRPMRPAPGKKIAQTDQNMEKTVDA